VKKSKIRKQFNKKVRKYIPFYEHPAYIGFAEKGDKRNIFFEKQFNTDGFDNSVTWSLDYSIIKFILPRLGRYYELADKVIDIDAHEGFRKAIEEMIEGFTIALDKETLESKKDYDKIQKAWDNLAKWHNGLWW